MMRFLLSALLLATPAAAAFQDLSALDVQIAAALGVPAAPVDRRLRLAACPQAPVVEPGLAGTVTVRCPAVGWRLRVLVPAGVATAPQAQAGFAPAAFVPRLRAEPVVRRGDPVQMSVETANFSVTLEAVAETDGAPGDRIRVRSDEKGGPRTAEVVEAGRVRIAGFK